MLYSKRLRVKVGKKFRQKRDTQHYLRGGLHSVRSFPSAPANSDVIYKFETLSVTLREEHRLRVLENMVLRRIFVHERDEATGGW
jgi:hypothetical protein